MEEVTANKPLHSDTAARRRWAVPLEKVMHLLRTRHSLEFDPLTAELDPGLSPYADCYDDYPLKRKKLGCLIGTDSFLWCIPAQRKFRHYESAKPVEWEIKVSNTRVLGYVDDQRWHDFLEGRSFSIDKVYFKRTPPSNEYSVLVYHPLYREEIQRMIIFRFIKSNEADIICERDF